MAHGDESKTTTKANYAVKALEVAAPFKKPVVSAPTPSYQSKKPEQKNYGAWGPIFQNKKNFTDMHFC